MQHAHPGQRRGHARRPRRLDTDELSIVDFKSTDRAQAEDVTRGQLHVYAVGYEELTGEDADLIEVLNLDEAGFEREMEAQRERARSASAFGVDYNSLVKVEGETRFLGYDTTSASGTIVALYRAGQPVDMGPWLRSNVARFAVSSDGSPVAPAE